MLHDPNDYNMVVSINQIGHVMGIRTIAEFVEDEAICNALRRLGVDYVQGYWVGRPQMLESETLPRASNVASIDSARAN
ncbi:MAG: hypothetical protein AMJ69_02260 [Gammaproteobacteria bacterium SG8_47]|nr:MAG: hypothetical protein AMJ69_02260 [Gammaproteobacteria bacterium SG8_47]